jgi:hypothetical protein
MRRCLLLALLIASALAVHTASAQTTNPVPPLATTGAASAITLTSATVAGTVDPEGAPTTWHVEYGTTTSYGLTTAPRDAGDGDAALAVSIGLSRLTSDTTYHYRVVATNAAGIARGADRTLRTTRPATPLAPSVSTGAVQGLTARAVTLTGTVNPRGVATRHRFDWGRGTSLDRHTGYVATGAGTTATGVSVALTLQPNTRYSYRVVATSAAGTARGSRRSFTTPRAPAILSTALRSARVPYGDAAVISGRATSAGVGNVSLVLERQIFPFTGPFERIASQRSASSGSFRFTVSPLLLSARLRVVAQTSPAVTSVPRTVRTTPRVSIAARRISGRRVRFSGTASPALSGARASLQRRKNGRYVTLRRVQLRPLGALTRSRYRMTIAARRTAAYYRVVITPAKSSGHARGVSSLRHLGGLRRR